MAYESLMVFTGNANPLLAHAVVRRLNIPLGHATVGKFSDGEIMVELLENVRGKDCFVLQSTCAPANDSLMEVLLIVDALKRASAARVTAAIPYFGYARQDRRPRSARVAISAKVAANMLQSAGVDRVLTMDLHADQIQGFFDVPVDNIYATPVLLGDVWKHQYENLLVVSPDVGGVVRARDGEAPGVGPRDHRQAPAPAERVGSDERDRRRERPQLRHHGRHGGYGQHAVQGRAGAEGRRCDPRGRLLHAPGALGRGGGAHRRVAAGRAGRDGLDPAVEGRSSVQEDPRAVGRWAARGNDSADQQRGFGELAVHRIDFSTATPGRGRRLNRGEATWHSKSSRNRAKGKGGARAAACATAGRCPGFSTGARNPRSTSSSITTRCTTTCATRSFTRPS